MSAIDYEAEYNNRARVPEHPGIIEGWARDAAAFRAGATAELGLAYGAGERCRLDLFLPAGDRGRAVVVFIHGGYWQALDRSFFSHMAQGLVAYGIPVAVPSYDLCPQVRIGDIVAEMRAACAFLRRRLQRPLVVAGHSAGGHLAACMLATDWPAIAPDLPAGTVTAAYAISGLFDLPPLLGTSINSALGMDEAEARRWSPLLWPAPAGRTLDAVVGGAESGEYLRQSRTIAETWGAAGTAARWEAVPGANHFTVIAALADPASAMTRRLADLSGA
ncbi:alpha/beta hydrolase [Chelatococcus sp. SYSU_G07232]|uniref:Alpha/beta hydrolase n=1 Tax=Chelatococcus albus TaxID=3047466 RepID=A0ABT7AJ98_9HYPH|nr:alpha/beta hydrolase [Chelatococcus sp. SYSU_G07232]MDJ1159433.1 alpha/beta hydrolase [Chelatococcus sp. SYSU_G07232]